MSKTGSSILFVDNEAHTLRALEKLMSPEEWTCYYASSGKAALEIMQQQQMDLVVSGVIMPEMTGFDLFHRIQKQYPAVVRIFLTSFHRQETVTQALADGCTQQIIPKPWIDQELKEILRSALRQCAQQKKLSPELQSLINSVPLLPPLPESYTQVRACINEDEVDIEKMAEVIGQDVALATALLHWANSALFGQRFQVDSIKKAIVVLGTDIVESLILSESINRAVASQLTGIPGFSLKEFQHHSFATAILSRLLIKSLYNSDKELQDRAFIAGLLHDLGKLAAASFFPEKFSAALAMAQKEQCPAFVAEKARLGTTHMELGAFLAEWWALPPFIAHTILWHHKPQSSPIEQDVVHAVHVANLLSHQFGFAQEKPTGDGLSASENDRFYLTEDGIEILRKQTEELLQALTA